MEKVFEASMVLCGIYTLPLNLVWIHYVQCSDCKLWRNWVPCSIGVLWCGSGFVCKWTVRTAHGQKRTSGCVDPLNCIGTGYLFFVALCKKHNFNMSALKFLSFVCSSKSMKNKHHTFTERQLCSYGFNMSCIPLLSLTSMNYVSFQPRLPSLSDNNALPHVPEIHACALYHLA